MGTFNGTIFLVTEHGWCDWKSTWGDYEPRSVPRPRNAEAAGFGPPVSPLRRRRDAC